MIFVMFVKRKKEDTMPLVIQVQDVVYMGMGKVFTQKTIVITVPGNIIGRQNGNKNSWLAKFEVITSKANAPSSHEGKDKEIE